MGRQQATLENLKSIATVALVGLGLAILVGKLSGPAAQVDSILSCVARETGLLPYIVPAAWRALQSYVFDHQGFSLCHLQILVSCWSLVQIVAGAA
jgi:hypothetical protein